jgi:hypothetical protein
VTAWAASGSTFSPDAVLGAVVTVGLFLLVALWKLATMLAEVRGQVRHNGGSSLKDDARTAAEEAVRAREMAERVASDLAVFRGHQADDTARTSQAISQVQHDVTTMRAGQELLLQQQITLEERVVNHRERNATQVKVLTEAVAKLGEDRVLADTYRAVLTELGHQDSDEPGRP